MPAVVCSNCSRSLDFSGEPLAFCPYCGKILSDPRLAATAEFTDEPGRTTPFIRSDSSARPPPQPDVPPDQVAGYRLIRELGRGGMGTVYEAEDLRLGRHVALKLIAPEFVSSNDAVERFRQEGRLASTIAHARCVFVIGADEAEGRPYIVMELMPGETLQTLVDANGPLTPEVAIRKILDVIEGLHEAHQLGVIHRDVKPSNCFLERDGRVKIGDFGLSKSLVADVNLTRTGSFIGTPLYASPEQIKGEALDARTDVYSVAATLYFLITGTPPFREKDATATLARIVTESAPSMRSIRPDVDSSLDRAVLLGLERQRSQRCATLDDLRASLLPFIALRRSFGIVGLRAVAFVLDTIVVNLVLMSLIQLALTLSTGKNSPVLSTTMLIASLTVDMAIWMFSFVLCESFFGQSPAKWLMRLAVRSETGRDRTEIRRLLLRTLVAFALLEAPSQAVNIAAWSISSPWMLALRWPAGALGVVILASTMRFKNGFRGLHDVVSGTRVVLKAPTRRRAPVGRRPPSRPESLRQAMSKPVGVVDSVGPFRVRGAVRWDQMQKVLVGEDSSLGRSVWVVLRQKGAAAPSPTRREIARPTRPRWLDGGVQSGGRWDAFVAPTGCSLADLVGLSGLPWHEARPILVELAEEMAASLAEGSLPESASTEQVWIQRDGHVQFVDFLTSTGSEAAAIPSAVALNLLRSSSRLILEGGRSRSVGRTEIHAPIPLHARAVLDRLDADDPDQFDFKRFHDDLNALGDRTEEVAPSNRLAQLTAWSLFHAVPFLVLYAGLIAIQMEGSIGHSFSPAAIHRLSSILLWSIPALGAIWIGWSMATRGGLSFRMTGLALVGPDGRPASRLRCAWRTALVWALPLSLAAAGVLFYRSIHPGPTIPLFCYGLSAGILIAYVPLAFFNTSRGIHDVIAGTHVVPR